MLRLAGWMHFSACRLANGFGQGDYLLSLADSLLESSSDADQNVGVNTLLATGEPIQVLPRLRWFQPRHARPLLEWLLAGSRGGLFTTPTDEKRDLYGQVVEAAMGYNIRLIPTGSSTYREEAEEWLAISLILARSPSPSHWLSAKEVLGFWGQKEGLSQQRGMSRLAKSRLLELIALSSTSSHTELYIDLHAVALQIAECVLTEQKIARHLDHLPLLTPALLLTRLAEGSTEESRVVVAAAVRSLRFSWRYEGTAYAVEALLRYGQHTSYFRKACGAKVFREAYYELIDWLQILRSIHPSWPAISGWAFEAHQGYMQEIPKRWWLFHCVLIGRSTLFNWPIQYEKKTEARAKSIEFGCREWLLEAGFPLAKREPFHCEARTTAVAVATLSAVASYGTHLEIRYRCEPHGEELRLACEEFSRNFTYLLQKGELEAHLNKLCDTFIPIKEIPRYLERCRLLAVAWSVSEPKGEESFLECALRELATFYPNRVHPINNHWLVQLHDMRLHQWLFTCSHLGIREKLELLEIAPARLQAQFTKNLLPTLAIWDGLCDRLLYAMRANIGPAILRKLSHQLVDFFSKSQDRDLNAYRPFFEEWGKEAIERGRANPLQLASYRIMAHDLQKS